MRQTVTREIARAIAEVEDTEPDDLNIVLQNYITLEAVQQLVEHDSNSWRLQFETSNHVVEVTGDGTIFVDDERQRELF